MISDRVKRAMLATPDERMAAFARIAIARGELRRMTNVIKTWKPPPDPFDDAYRYLIQHVLAEEVHPVPDHPEPLTDEDWDRAFLDRKDRS